MSTDCLLRRRDLAEVIGAALVAKVAGLGHRRAGAAGAPPSTVRSWLRRFAASAEAIRVWFTVLAHDLNPMLAPLVLTDAGGRRRRGHRRSRPGRVAASGTGAALAVRLLRQ